MNSRPPYSNAVSPHPDLEQVAALIDGRLPEADKATLTDHLASCRNCYELFAETARFVHDRGAADADVRARVLRPSGRRWRRITVGATLLAAAAVGAVLVWGPALDRSGVEVLPASVLVNILDPDDAAGAAIAETMDERGWPILLGEPEGPTPAQESSFRLGVRVLELAAALEAGDRRVAELLTYRIETILDGMTDTGAARALYAEPEGIRAQLQAGAALDELRERAKEADELLGPEAETGAPGFVEPLWFAFGKWAAAGELAASTGQLEYFDSRWHGSLHDRLEETELPPQVQEDVRAVDTALGPALVRPGSETRRELERAFEELIAVAGGGERNSDAP